MDWLFYEGLRKRSGTIPALIAVSSIAVLLLNAYGLTLGITYVLPHLFYIPIILTAYYYPRRGIPFAAILSLCYCALSFTVDSQTTVEIISAIARSGVFIIIAAVVGNLSERMQRDNRMCHRLVSVVRSSGDAIVGETLEGIVTDWNTGAEELYGFTSAEMMGTSIFCLVPEERRNEKLLLLEKIRRGETTERVETERIRRDGTRIHVSLSSSPILGGAGEIAGISEIAHDITERKQLQQEIAEQKDWWELTFDAVPEMIAIIDDQYRIVQVNKAMADRIGVTPEKAVGLPCYEAVHHTASVPGSCPHAVLLRDGMNHATEIHEENPNQDFFLTVAPIRDASGAILGSVHILRDITERKHAEEALNVALKKLNMLSQITRHDILNQVMGLRTFLELSREDLKDTPFAAYIEKEDQAAEAIQKQIEFTKYYQDIGVNAPQWQNVETLITRALTQLSHPSVDVEIAISNLEIFADPLIEKVFFNLMENSLRHGERVSRMAFSMHREENVCVITYSDDGIGITAGDKQKLFQRGFGKHTGLGLFLSREILSITNITIMENGELGKGVRFELRVPPGGSRVLKPDSNP